MPGVKVTNLICQRYHLEKCKKLNLASKDVTNRAKINLGTRRAEYATIKGLRKETNHLLALQIVEKNGAIMAEEKKLLIPRRAQEARLSMKLIR